MSAYDSNALNMFGSLIRFTLSQCLVFQLNSNLAYVILAFMSELVLEIKNLRKEYGAKVAVHDVSFHANRGEVVGLLGPNGAGKTTTIQTLLGLVLPTSGTVNIFGMPIATERVKILQRCNFSSAYIWLPENLKVRENLNVFAALYQVKRAKEKINELLEMFEISQFANTLTGKLSSGESTRLNLCKALLNDPELLMLDEPTASLDPDIADKVRKLIVKIQKEKNMTVLYTSHNMKDVQEICNRVVFMQHGKVHAEGSPKQILAQFKQKSLEDVFIRIARGGDLIEEEETEKAGEEA